MTTLLDHLPKRALASAFIAASVAMLSPSGALAQFGGDYGETGSDLGKSLSPSDSQRSSADAKGVGENILEDFPFMEHARNNSGGSCCGMKDGVRIEARDIEETDDPKNPYRVLMRRTSSGLQIAQPFWVKVPAEKVLSGERINSICEAYDDAVEAHNAKKPEEEIDLVCTPPSFSIFFIRDASMFSTLSGKHVINGKYYDSGTVLTPEQYNVSNVTTKYCFYKAEPAF